MNYIGGEWVDSASGDTFESFNPASGDTIGTFPRSTAEDVDRAVAAAKAAYEDWRLVPAPKRGEILYRFANLLMEEKEGLTDLMAREMGKVKAEAGGDVQEAIDMSLYMAGEGRRLFGQTTPSELRDKFNMSVRQPIGVVGAITPWNFPIAIPSWKIAPALVFGNTVVFKPADAVPASAWALVDALHRAGLPPGVLNLVMGRGSEIGDVLTGSAEVAAVSFTGSVPTGERVLAAATRRRARVQLEMGGKNPLVIADDADLDLAVEVAVQGSYGSTGQRCTASSRLIVADRVHDDFVDRLGKRLQGWRVGDARADGTDMGPVVDEAQLSQDLHYIALAAKEGAEVLGGQQLQLDQPGHYLTPALLVGTQTADTVNREEIFGPVASVIRVADRDEAVAVANDTEFGLTAGIVTRSLARATDFRRRSGAGMVMVNVPTAGVDFHVPFGGRGGSSYGPREQGSAAREFFTVSKTSYVAAGAPF